MSSTRIRTTFGRANIRCSHFRVAVTEIRQVLSDYTQLSVTFSDLTALALRFSSGK